MVTPILGSLEIAFLSGQWQGMFCAGLYSRHFTSISSSSFNHHNNLVRWPYILTVPILQREKLRYKEVK